jgi:hypothetical protein
LRGKGTEKGPKKGTDLFSILAVPPVEVRVMPAGLAFDALVCYCFQYTKKNIKDDFLQNGYSSILEKIKSEKKKNSCNGLPLGFYTS